MILLTFAFFLACAEGGMHFVVYFWAHDDSPTDGKKGPLAPFIILEAITGLYCLCLFWVLLRYDDIDVCQQLDRETRLLQGNTNEVKKKDEEMRVFWTNIQEYNAVWLYRTIPRLDLLETVSHKLEDSSPQEMMRLLPIANDRLGKLEEVLGPIENWKGDVSVSEEDKKRFANNLRLVYQQHNLTDILDALDALSNNNHSRLKNLPGYDAKGKVGGFGRSNTRTGGPNTGTSRTVVSRGAANAPPGNTNIELARQASQHTHTGRPRTSSQERPVDASPDANLAWMGGREADEDGYMPMIV